MNTCTEYVSTDVCVRVYIRSVSARGYDIEHATCRRLSILPYIRNEIKNQWFRYRKTVSPTTCFVARNNCPWKTIVGQPNGFHRRYKSVYMSPTTDDINDLARIAAHVATTSRSPLSHWPIGRRGHARDVLYPTHTFPRKHKRTQEGEESRPSLS